MLKIRTATPADTDAITALILPIQQQEFGIPITLEAQPDLGNIQQFYQHGAGNFWLAELDGQVVGSIALLDIGNQQAALRKMFVAGPFRGRDFGVAASLLDELLSWARRQRLSDIFLGTTDKFLAAHRFYEKHGFEALGRTALPTSFPVMAVDSKFYHLALPPHADHTPLHRQR
ncbi:GNAT family N-acetyltransferase [Paucibacter sp. APW11]|uniref:GNAT family N-acetyltransferase n=1 Tax=Roseateles aquae TaxID=3077235 RepID=A0ABU3PIC4_9BURK|nr:GNAT family N-acetyltransferase [Paucibacter sp. APW11]MDT9002283.1 GNAT family N-acetyltransferase [Paucibacter sp. APW11]